VIARRTLAALVVAPLLSACGGDSDAATGTGSSGTKKAGGVNIGPDQNRIRGKKVDEIAALVPAAIRERGTLKLGQSADASPPLGFYATDDKTRIGSEIDLATIVADTLGLKLDNDEVSWENLFVGLDSGKFDAVFSNVTVTEERKEKYDFATYRLDNISFEAKKGTDWKVDGPEDVAGRTIAVSSGTNQEKILVDWSKQNGPQGRHHQVLPEGHGLLPRPPVGPYRRLPRPQPVRRVPRGHGRAVAGRRHALRRRRQAPGQDRRHHEEGERSRRRVRRSSQPRDRGRQLRARAQALGPVERGRAEVGDQPARPAEDLGDPAARRSRPPWCSGEVATAGPRRTEYIGATPRSHLGPAEPVWKG